MHAAFLITHNFSFASAASATARPRGRQKEQTRRHPLEADLNPNLGISESSLFLHPYPPLEIAPILVAASDTVPTEVAGFNDFFERAVLRFPTRDT